jgi:hypothetical protein
LGRQIAQMSPLRIVSEPNPPDPMRPGSSLEMTTDRFLRSYGVVWEEAATEASRRRTNRPAWETMEDQTRWPDQAARRSR